MNPRIIGVLCVVLASQIEALGQIAFKKAANKHASQSAMAGLHVLIRAPGWVLFGLGCYGLEAIFYSVSLRLLDLSLAYPVGSLSFVGVAVLSRLWLREIAGPRRWAGVSLIVTGIMLLGVS